VHRGRQWNRDDRRDPELTTEATDLTQGVRLPLYTLCPLCKRKRMNIQKVGVLGCGLMGSGIAQVAATAGFGVTVLEVEQKLLDKGFAGIEKSLAKLAEKGTLKEKPEAIRARLKGTTRPADLAD